MNLTIYFSTPNDPSIFGYEAIAYLRKKNPHEIGDLHLLKKQTTPKEKERNVLGRPAHYALLYFSLSDQPLIRILNDGKTPKSIHFPKKFITYTNPATWKSRF